MKLIAILGILGLVAGCAVDAGEEPGSSSEELTRTCSLHTASNGSAILSKPTCCYGVDTCFITANGSSTVIATLYAAGGPNSHTRSSNGEYSVVPSDLPENRHASCAVLSLAPWSTFSTSTGTNKCFVTTDRVDRGVNSPKSDAMIYHPGAGERRTFIAGATATGCDFVLHNEC